MTAESLRHFIGDNKIVRGVITSDDLVERRSVICGETKLCAKRLEIATLSANATEKNIHYSRKRCCPLPGRSATTITVASMLEVWHLMKFNR